MLSPKIRLKLVILIIFSFLYQYKKTQSILLFSPRRRRPRQYRLHPLLEKRTNNKESRPLRKLMPVRETCSLLIGRFTNRAKTGGGHPIPMFFGFYLGKTRSSLLQKAH